jgi:hypothetical protein
MWAAAVAFAVLIGLLNWSARGWSAPLMVAAVLALAAYYIRAVGWQTGLLALLIVTSMVDRYTFSAGPVALRAEEIAALISVAVLAANRIGEGGRGWLKPDLAEVLLAAWFVCSLLSSLIGSPDRRLSAKIIVLVAACSLGFFLPRRILAGDEAKERLEAVLRWLLILFATEGAWGTLAYLVHLLGPTVSLTPNPASGHLSAYGTLWEQNVFGAIAAAGAVAWVYLGPRRFGRYAAFGLGLCASGLVVSVTRAAWLAAGISGAVGLAVPGLRRRINLLVAGTGLLGGVIAAAAVLVVDSVGTYTVTVTPATGPPPKSGLFGALFNMTDFIGRLNQTGSIWADIKHDVFFGSGVASYEALHVIDGVPQHVASLPLLILNDTGIIGLLVFGAFVVAVIARVWTWRRDEVVTGLSQVAIVLLIANLATETTELMVGWLMIGLLVAATDVASSAGARQLSKDQQRSAA